MKHLKTLQFIMEYATTTGNKGLEYNLERLASEVQEDILSEQIEVATKPIKTNKMKNLFVNKEKRLIKVDLEDIYLIEAKGDYINIKTYEKNYFIHSTLKNIESKLPDNFFKAHRSYIINLNEIIDIEDNSILIGNDVIPITRVSKKDLVKQLNIL